MQILVEAPGRAPFQLTRLGGAPHGQPALALRQVQVLFCGVMHELTDRLMPGLRALLTGSCHARQPS
jgi:hypothetical protein